MNEQIKQKIIKAVEELDFGSVIITVQSGRVVNVSVQMSLDLQEKKLDKV